MISEIDKYILKRESNLVSLGFGKEDREEVLGLIRKIKDLTAKEIKEITAKEILSKIFKTSFIEHLTEEQQKELKDSFTGQIHQHTEIAICKRIDKLAGEKLTEQKGEQG